MTANDEWGQDPSVKAMRRVFARMESAQKKLLQEIGISPTDPRLRACREYARDLFERAISRAETARLKNEEDAADLYIHFLAQSLKKHGLPVPGDRVREDRPVARPAGEAGS
ncbi:MAG: hypothetical protein J7M32_06705 [Deltaproteobacteria bacterium]|nr:hypothetical protein [Deltaproteobacteria bacterium]